MIQILPTSGTSSKDDLYTYEDVDNYAREHFNEEYASLPAPSTIEIVDIPSEIFSPKHLNWPGTVSQRIKVGELDTKHTCYIANSDNNIYASVALDATLSPDSRLPAFARVYISTQNDLVFSYEWTGVHWIQPFNEASIQGYFKSGRRQNLGALTLYYLLANQCLKEVRGSTHTFYSHFERACQTVFAMHQARSAPPFGGNSMPTSPRMSLSPSNHTRNPSLANTGVQVGKQSARLQSRRPQGYGDEAGPSNTFKCRLSLPGSASLGPGEPGRDKGDVDLSVRVQSSKRLKTSNTEFEVKKPQVLKDVEMVSESQRVRVQRNAREHAPLESNSYDAPEDINFISSDEKEGLQGGIEVLQHEKYILQDEVNALEEESGTLQADIYIIEKQRETLEDDVITLEYQKISLQEDFDSLKDDIDTFKEEFGTESFSKGVTNENLFLQTKVAKLEIDNKVLQRKLRREQEAKQALQNQVVGLAINAKDTQRKLKQLKKRMREWSADLY